MEGPCWKLLIRPAVQDGCPSNGRNGRNRPSSLSVDLTAALTPHPATMCQSTCPGTQISTTPFLTSFQERCAGRICNSRLLIALQQESQRKIAVASVSCLCSACENQH